MSNAIALRNVRVFDASAFGEPVDVMIEGNQIGAIEPSSARDPDTSATVVEGAGGYLLPGLIDAHVHLGGPETLETFARYGVTTVLDMGSWPAQRVDGFRRAQGVSDVRSSGPVSTSPLSRHAARIKDRPDDSLVRNPADAVRFVAARKGESVDYIKIVIDLPGFDQDTVDALVVAAHAEGYRTIVHAATYEAIQMAHRAGTDVIAHAPIDHPIDDALARSLAERGTVVVPTLTMMEATATNLAALGVAGASYAAAKASVETMRAAGVIVLAGTDANTTAGVPASPRYGDSLHHELELLVDSGYSTIETLSAATSVTASNFDLPDRGRVQTGLRADLVLLEEDPTEDIRGTRGIRQVWCAGTPQL